MAHHQLLPSLRKTMAVVDSGDRQAAVGLPNTSLFSDHPHSDLTCNNLSGSRKRLRNDQLPAALVAPVAALLPQLVGFSNPSSAAAAPIIHFNKAASGASVISSSAGVRAAGVSRDQTLPRALNSSAASTSGRQHMISATQSPDPPPSLISHDLLAQICQHNSETDALIRFQNGRLQFAVEELGKRHCRSLLSIFQQRVAKRLREKDIELENASRRNTELEEKINQVCAENQLWFNLARSNEAVASSLRRSLEQVLLENTAGAPLMEGYGDSDGRHQFPADDAQSYNCLEEKDGGWATPAGTACREKIRRQMICRVCGGDDVCGLVLPCRHLCLCMDCETSISFCPICNNPKKACLRIFIS
ncbi:hypothetical protein KSP39_PZI023394 [Platanthera zijinensis]|uniref:RING-type domain-containing protein n=1 Tax=Platanthera zijinensis TaxID=2320716 RepID=A0AAP0ATD2_9ASPA